MTEKRTALRGVSPDEAEPSDIVVTLDAEFFLLGRSKRMPRCSFEEKTERDIEVDALLFERGVLGAVDVSVDSDAFESDGVSGPGFDTDDEGVDGFFSDDRVGGGGSDTAGAEPLLTCKGRLGRDGAETPRGVSGVSECRLPA